MRSRTQRWKSLVCLMVDSDRRWQSNSPRRVQVCSWPSSSGGEIYEIHGARKIASGMHTTPGVVRKNALYPLRLASIKLTERHHRHATTVRVLNVTQKMLTLFGLLSTENLFGFPLPSLPPGYPPSASAWLIQAGSEGEFMRNGRTEVILWRPEHRRWASISGVASLRGGIAPAVEAQ